MFVETQETNGSTAPSAPCSPTPRGPTAETMSRRVTSQTRSTIRATCVMPPSPRRAPGRCTSQRSTTPSGSRSRPCNSLHRLIPKYSIEQRTFPLFSTWHSLCPESWHLFAGLDYLDALIAPHMTKVVDGLGRSVWRCLDCGKDFKLKGDMSRHVEAFHITHPGLQCDLCEKVLKTRESMRSHMNNVHKNENLLKYNFWIKLLPFSFCHSLLIVIDFSLDVECFTAWSADHREVDEKIETLIGRLPEGAFVCHVCGYSNNTKQNMKKHVETHIETPGYPCAFCQKHFKTRNSLNTHVSTHHREERKNQLNLSFWFGSH